MKAEERARTVLCQLDTLEGQIRDAERTQRLADAQIARTYAENTTCTLSTAVALKIAEDIEGLG